MPPHSSVPSAQVTINNSKMNVKRRHQLWLLALLAVIGLGYASSSRVRSAVANLDLGRTGVMIGAGEGNVGAPNVSFAAGMVPFQTCTLGCTATVPPSGTAGQSVSFQSTGTPSNCVSGPTFQWSFGNGDTSSSQNPNYTYSTPGVYNWQLTVSAGQSGGGGGSNISTVAGGEGEGVPAGQASFYRLTGISRDPLGRGIFLSSQRESTNVIYFVNTSASQVTLAGKTFAPGEVRVVAGGGTIFSSENAPGTDLDLGTLRAVAVNNDGSLVFFIENGAIRALNVGTNTVTIAGASLGPANVRTLAVAGFGTELNALAVNPADNSVFAADATAGINRVFRVEPSTGNTSIIVGNGQPTNKTDPFVPGQASGIRLLQPRGIKFNGSTLVVADTGHSRVINVSPATAAGNATLVHQYSTEDGTFINGVAVAGGIAYAVNGNLQTVHFATGGAIAGQSFVACNYQSSPPCGDGGQPGNATFAFVGSGSVSQEAAMDGDASGIYLVDQSPFSRARVRYINRTGSPVTLAGVTVPGSTIQTIIGRGLDFPFDGGLSNAAFLSSPIGVAVDANNNLWSTDTLSVNRLRFHNRGASQVTIFPGTASQQIVPAGATATVNANAGALGDVIPAIQGNFNDPQGLFATSQGIYVVDSKGGPTYPAGFGGQRTSALRFVNTSGATVTFYPSSAAPVAIPPGSMARIAGCEPLPQTCAELGFARTSKFVGMSDVAVGPNGDIYVTAVAESKVRKISLATGNVTDLNIPFSKYTGIGLSPEGRLYIADTTGGRLLRETGANSNVFTQLVASGLSSPRDVAISSSNTAYVTTAGNHRIIQVTDAGATSTFAGTTQGFSGDGGAATSARINISPSTIDVGVPPANSPQPQTVNIALSSAGDVFFADTNNNRLRRVGGAGGVVTCVRSGQITINAAQNPLPSITSLSPSSTTAGGGGFQMLVNGSNFVGSSVVNWNGSPRTTSFVNSGQLQAQVTAADIASAGNAGVTVFNPAPGGGTSNSSTFTINNPAPTLSGLNPSSAIAGGIAFTLTATGNNFVSTSTVRWNGSNRTTTFINSTTLQAAIGGIL